MVVSLTKTLNVYSTDIYEFYIYMLYSYYPYVYIVWGSLFFELIPNYFKSE